MSKSKAKNKNRGFTLIEMIVVIGVIGLLTTMILVSVGRIRKNSIDTRRKSNIENVRGAITMYYAAKSAWPSISSGWSGLITDLSDGGYISDNIPADEDGDGVNDYSVCSCSSCSPACSSASVQMKLCTSCMVEDGEGCSGTPSKYCLEVK
ncbi:MAG: type II secretion system protein [Candidatus Moranbacteria bacterium]|nr:type II secretion system protein [Candidatus Moranbacteria bacterium]